MTATAMRVLRRETNRGVLVVLLSGEYLTRPQAPLSEQIGMIARVRRRKASQRLIEFGRYCADMLAALDDDAGRRCETIALYQDIEPGVKAVFRALRLPQVALVALVTAQTWYVGEIEGARKPWRALSWEERQHFRDLLRDQRERLLRRDHRLRALLARRGFEPPADCHIARICQYGVDVAHVNVARKLPLIFPSGNLPYSAFFRRQIKRPSGPDLDITLKTPDLEVVSLFLFRAPLPFVFHLDAPLADNATFADIAVAIRDSRYPGDPRENAWTLATACWARDEAKRNAARLELARLALTRELLEG